MKSIFTIFLLPFFVFVLGLQAKAQSQKATPTYRDQVYDWAYNRGGDKLDLDEASAKVIADFFAYYDEAFFEKLKYVFRTEFNSGIKSAQDFKLFIQFLAKDGQSSNWLELAYARAQVKQKRLDIFNKHFNWAYTREKLNLSQKASAAVANLLTDISDEALVASISELLGAEIRLKGAATDANVLSLVSNLEKDIKNTSDTQALIANYKKRAKTANNYQLFYHWAYNRGAQSLDLDDKPAAAIAEFLTKQPENLISDLKSMFAGHVQMGGRTESAVLDLITKLNQTMQQPEGLRNFLKKNAQTQEHFNWALNYVAYTQKKIFEVANARAIALFISEASPENAELLKTIIPNLFLARVLSNIDSLKSELQIIINDTAALKAVSEKSESELKIAQYRGGIYYWAYNRSNDGLDLNKDEALLLTDFIVPRDEKLVPIYKEIFKIFVGAGFNSIKHLQILINDLAKIHTPQEIEGYKEKVKLQINNYNWIISNNGLYYSSLGRDQALSLAIVLTNTPPDQLKLIKEILLRYRQQGKTESLVSMTRALISGDTKKIKDSANYPAWVANDQGHAVCFLKNALDSQFSQSEKIETCLQQLPTEFKVNSQNECWEIATDVAPIQKVERELCENPIILDIRHAIHTFNRPIHLYHYVEASRLKYGQEKLNSEDDRIKNHHIEWTAYFWNLPQRQNQSQNAGLYTAIDPVVSRKDYGGGRPVLYRVEFSVGLRYLNHMELKDAFSQKSAAYLAKQNCSVSNPSAFFHRNATLSPECLRVLFSLVRDLQIAAMAYSWTAIPIPECTNQVALAYIIYNQNILTKERVRIFHGDEIPKSPEDFMEAQNIQRLISETQNYPIWTSRSLPSISDAEHRAWKKRHLVNCP